MRRAEGGLDCVGSLDGGHPIDFSFANVLDSTPATPTPESSLAESWAHQDYEHINYAHTIVLLMDSMTARRFCINVQSGQFLHRRRQRRTQTTNKKDSWLVKTDNSAFTYVSLEREAMRRSFHSSTRGTCSVTKVTGSQEVSHMEHPRSRG